jgi:hypothetical protein
MVCLMTLALLGVERMAMPPLWTNRDDEVVLLGI